MNRSVLLLVALIAFLAASSEGCAKSPLPPEPPVVYVPPLDAGVGDSAESNTESQSTCGVACINLRFLNCPEGLSTPGGARCYDVCASSGTLLNAACAGSAKSVEELRRSCHVRCAK